MNNDLREQVDTGAMAREMYQKMCEYVGSDHEGKCIEYIKFTLDSFDAEIENQKKKNALIRTATLDEAIKDIKKTAPVPIDLHNSTNELYYLIDIIVRLEQLKAIDNLRGNDDNSNS